MSLLPNVRYAVHRSYGRQGRVDAPFAVEITGTDLPCPGKQYVYDPCSRFRDRGYLDVSNHTCQVPAQENKEKETFLSVSYAIRPSIYDYMHLQFYPYSF